MSAIRIDGATRCLPQGNRTAWLEFDCFGIGHFGHYYEVAWIGQELARDTEDRVRSLRVSGAISRVSYTAWRTWFRRMRRESLAP